MHNSVTTFCEAGDTGEMAKPNMIKRLAECILSKKTE